ncbi:conserved domain protein [Enterococcus faecium PC4.1]|nr:conserved domain protein [Enterococcus faecium PC4.1]
MKIAIIGATGHAGSFILDEALSRDLDVTAIVRHPEKITIRCSVYTKGFI